MFATTDFLDKKYGYGFAVIAWLSQPKTASSLMVIVSDLKLGPTDLVFLKSDAKADGVWYWNLVLSQPMPAAFTPSRVYCYEATNTERMNG